MCSLIDNVTPDSWLSDVDNNLEALECILHTIPEVGMIPHHSLKDGQLVRFRGMIQDMADPVLYLNQYEVINNKTGSKELRCGKYKDTLKLEDDEMMVEDSPNHKHCERRSIYCVSVPGLSPWAKSSQISSSVKSTSDKNMKSTANINMDVCNESNQIKRHAEDMEQDDSVPSSSELNKRLQTDVDKSNQQVDILLNHPIEGDNNYSCLINVYEEIEDNLVKMNSIIDVVGFVSFSSDCDDFAHLPASLVPRLHAVTFKRIVQRNPFLTVTLDESAIISTIERTRAYLTNALTSLFLGDGLATEYILCNLISKIYHRNEVMTLGNFSVNLTKVPLENNYPEEVCDILSRLVPKSHYLPMSLEKMNTDKFLPEKDYEQNCLKSGILQLSDHTHLFLDETKMEPGQLNTNGMANLRALNELAINQKLDYDFKYVKIEIPADIPIIVLSEGKSLINTSVQVILSSEAGQGPLGDGLMSVKELLKEPFLTDMRNYLHVVSHLNFNLSDDVIETIQNDYVKLRQEEKKVNESDLHLLLILARLISLSFGKMSLTKETWEKAFEMELFRKARINNREP